MAIAFKQFSFQMLTLYKDEEEAMNGLWAGYTQI